MIIIPTNQIPTVSQIQDVSLENPAEILKICVEMEQLCQKENGIGLSAVQVGLPIKLFIVNYNNKFRYFINCDYEVIEEEKKYTIEGCLSIKDRLGNARTYKVPRYIKIKINGYELDTQGALEYKRLDWVISDRYSIVFQHEIDHHKGILISDIGEEIIITR